MKKVIYLSFTLMLLSSCAKDPCAKISCINGGTCVNGQCLCPDGYGGPDCSVEQAPTKMLITKIVVTQFPPTDASGASWDLFDGADITIKFSKDGGDVLWNAPTYFENADYTQQYTFTPSPYIEIADPSSKHQISLYDYDSGSADDYMDGTVYTPYQKGNKFPKMVSIFYAGAKAKFDVYYNYVF